MSKTLLLADDSVVIQKLVGLSFANEDVEIVTTDNGDDAVLKAREIVPDVVLADVVMPGKSGYEVCEAIKQDPALAHIPVILLTGTFEAFDEARAAAAGADGGWVGEHGRHRRAVCVYLCMCNWYKRWVVE